ncbi:metalloproteinase inhibitor 3 isoform X2 [Belonocnema kinseyi]|nr:metalloproteinase inhibitor 3 isoform X2 [Belonocnema kinseyi]XP_033210330.1 metalloproteinase inhibitor 3 isoform X2 [Belonocnema kinseyi]
MRWPTPYISFLLVAFLSLTVDKLEACSCAPAHPQTKFCKADFVAVIKVKDLEEGEFENLYRVKVKRVFKSNPEHNMILEDELWTPSTDGMCGVTLNLNMTYVVSGSMRSGKPFISICDLSMPWAKTTKRQRKGFRQLYREGCKCKIVFTPFQWKGTVLEKAGGKQCLWESEPGPLICQEEHGICMQGHGGCSWVPSVSYKNCIEQHQRHREQHRSREA